ncbi:MAG: DNA-3-methyladenine glycosylase II [Halieaceae bacterium]|jgi:DNA-3-methyladenine glycosylase II
MEKAHRHLLRSAKPYPTLHAAIKANGKLNLDVDPNIDLFTFLCQTMVSQQLSVKAADTIWGRVQEFKRRRRILKLETLTSEKYRDNLRNCGISGRKVESMIRLAQSFRRGDIIPAQIRRASHDDILMQISSLYGFGPWSAEMVSMFYAEQADVWSPGDVALVRGLKQLVPEEPDHRLIVAAFVPYRTYLALHLWQSIDAVPLDAS